MVKLIITRELDYSIRMLRALQDGEKKSTTDVCTEEDIPIHFAYRILKKLEQGGLVAITRGKEGGVTLACDLDKTYLKDVMLVVDDLPYFNACLLPDYICEYKKSHGGKCEVHANLIGIQNTMDNILGSTSLHTLITGDAALKAG